MERTEITEVAVGARTERRAPTPDDKLLASYLDLLLLLDLGCRGVERLLEDARLRDLLDDLPSAYPPGMRQAIQEKQWQDARIYMAETVHIPYLSTAAE